MLPTVLKLDIAGLPVEWISMHQALTLYARDRVKWEAGESSFTVLGGTRADGRRSSLTVNSIIAVADQSGRYEKRRPPPVTNRTLFQRDGYVCLYCGGRFPYAKLSRDHVIPASRGGRDVYTNLATACRDCNTRKDDRTPEEAGMPLLALPFEPDLASYLLLIASGRRILSDQQAWLTSFAEKSRRLS